MKQVEETNGSNSAHYINTSNVCELIPAMVKKTELTTEICSDYCEVDKYCAKIEKEDCYHMTGDLCDTRCDWGMNIDINDNCYVLDGEIQDKTCIDALDTTGAHNYVDLDDFEITVEIPGIMEYEDDASDQIDARVNKVI